MQNNYGVNPAYPNNDPGKGMTSKPDTNLSGLVSQTNQFNKVHSASPVQWPFPQGGSC